MYHDYYLDIEDINYLWSFNQNFSYAVFYNTTIFYLN